MALAELVQKLRSKKQATERSSYQHYLETVKSLADGDEADSDEVGHVLDKTGKDENDLERDVNLQQQRLHWHAQLQVNKQAVQDRLQAERELAIAQQRLQAAYDKLEPAVDQAQSQLDSANYRFLTTQGAESWLAENILDSELLERESTISAKLQDIIDELKPLLKDRDHKQSWLMNAEQRYTQLTGRNPDDWKAWGITDFFTKNVDIKAAESRVSDVQNELAQLDSLIRPRQQRQQELQAELNEIHQQKLLP